MLGLFYAIAYGMPVVILSAAAATGVFSARYFKGHPEMAKKDTHSWYLHERLYAAIWLAIAFPVLACLALVVPTFSEIQKLYGPLVDLLWLWALCCLASARSSVGLPASARLSRFEGRAQALMHAQAIRAETALERGERVDPYVALPREAAGEGRHGC